MIHHISVGTNDVSRARRFYDPVMQLLGLRLLKSGDKAAHYGVGDILFSLESPVDGQSASPATASTSPFRRAIMPWSMSFMRLAFAPEGATPAPPA
jgi:catechol 2,3-dioxygenase-like lactoylglutathione lyase family enzyme